MEAIGSPKGEILMKFLIIEQPKVNLESSEDF